jgi:hypothetical protein
MLTEVIMNDWKHHRFVVTENFNINIQAEHLVILTDIKFWNTHYEELKDFCDQHDGQISGMIVSFKNNHNLTLFLLKWA